MPLADVAVGVAPPITAPLFGNANFLCTSVNTKQNGTFEELIGLGRGAAPQDQI